MKNGLIVVPKENGVYAYRVTANWEQGAGNYAFSIEGK